MWTGVGSGVGGWRDGLEEGFGDSQWVAWMEGVDLIGDSVGVVVRGG